MVDPNAGKFIASLVKSLQMVCHGYMDFNDNIEIIGHINLRIDNRQKFDYIVNEQVCKQGGDSTFFQSNSYHSLPPGKHSGGEWERHQSGKFDEEGNVNNHHRLDDPVAAVGGSRVQVDLSGPVPVTRSTSAPSHDGFFATASSNRRRSHSRDSRLHSLDEEHSSSVLAQDHSFNHSSSLTIKDREDVNRVDMEMTGNGGDQTEPLAMYKDSETPRQRQDVIIKPEPSDLFDSTMDDSDSEYESGSESDCVQSSVTEQKTLGEVSWCLNQGGVTRDSDILDASSSASLMPAAHQSVLAAAAHSGHTMLATTTMGHPGFFDASLSSQNVTDPGDSSYLSIALGKERGSGQALSKEGSQNGEAMSLVTRARTPPDLGYPQGPTQLPQTAGVGEKESAPTTEKNHCSHCSKNFRTSDLLTMHIALIHTRRNYMSPKSLLSNTSSYIPSSSMSPQSQSVMRRASQSPSHQSTSSSSSRSKSQSPISMISHSQPQPLALTHSMAPTLTSSGSPSSSLGMSLPTLPNTFGSSASPAVNATAAAIAALAQSYAFDQPQVGPMIGSQGSPSMQASSHECHLCHMPFVSWAQLAQHQAQCPRRGPHRCEQCGKAFRSKTSLTDHINTIHRGVLFICRGCRETFKWRTHIYQHKRKCPALQNATFETGSFIEEVYPSNPPPEPPLPPPPSMDPIATEENMGSMQETEQMN